MQEKKRQRVDGRNEYSYIEVTRPRVIAEYQDNMEKVDLHNRFRQGMLKLHKVWKTTSWQHRIHSEIFSMCAVDAFLLSQHTMPRWQEAPTDHHNDSKLFEWLGVLLSQLMERVRENDHVAREEPVRTQAG